MVDAFLLAILDDCGDLDLGFPDGEVLPVVVPNSSLECPVDTVTSSVQVGAPHVDCMPLSVPSGPNFSDSVGVCPSIGISVGRGVPGVVPNFKDVLIGHGKTKGVDVQTLGFGCLPPAKKSSPPDCKGIPRISFSVEEVQSFSEGLEFTLIGKFSFGYPPIQVIKKEFQKLNLKGEYFIGVINARHVLIKLSNEMDYLQIWEKKTMWIDRYPMRILKWTIDFNSRVESPIVPIWVRFPDLPFCLFHREAMVEIASSIGKPLKLDEATERQSRPAYARVCVEINVLQERPNVVNIDMGDFSFEQRVFYENIPRYCTHCNHLGHDIKGCHWIKNKEKDIGQNVKVGTSHLTRDGNMGLKKEMGGGLQQKIDKKDMRTLKPMGKHTRFTSEDSANELEIELIHQHSGMDKAKEKQNDDKSMHNQDIEDRQAGGGTSRGRNISHSHKSKKNKRKKNKNRDKEVLRFEDDLLSERGGELEEDSDGKQIVIWGKEFNTALKIWESPKRDIACEGDVNTMVIDDIIVQTAVPVNSCRLRTLKNLREVVQILILLIRSMDRSKSWRILSLWMVLFRGGVSHGRMTHSSRMQLGEEDTPSGIGGGVE